MVLLAVVALASVASGRSLVFGGTSQYTNVLAKQIAPLLLQRAPLLNYRTVPLAATAARVVAAPQISFVAAPQRLQTVALAPQYQTLSLAPQAVQYTGPVQAAVLSQRSVQVVDVPSTGGIAPAQSIVIGPSIQPLDLEFQSQSSPVSVRQVHIPGQPNPPQFSSHQDEPDLLKQEIVKPIIHEVTEAIQPFRKITQEVRPVQETINQVITRGQQVQQVQNVAVQAAPVATVAVQAVQAAPALNLVGTVAAAAPSISVAAAPVSVANVNVIEEPVAETIVTRPLEASQLVFNGGLRALPALAKITRF